MWIMLQAKMVLPLSVYKAVIIPSMGRLEVSSNVV